MQNLSTRAASAALFFICTLSTLYWYIDAASGPFFLDDLPNFYGLRFIHDLESQIYYCLNGAAGNRWLAYLTFSFQKNAWISNDAEPFKLVNLIIHTANTLIIYTLSKKLLSFRSETPKTLALTISIIWFIHPIHTSSILYSVQRMNLLAGTALFSGLLFHQVFKFQNNIKNWSLYTLILWSLTIIGIGFKENAIMLPALAWLTALFSNKKYKNTALNFITYATPYIALITLLIIDNRLNFAGRDFTMVERLLSQVIIIKAYLLKIIFPVNSSFSLFYDDFNPVRNIWDYRFIAAVAFWSILLISTTKVRGYFSAPLFGLTFFLIGHMLESSIIPLELYFDHRNYVPSFGIIFGLVLFFNEILRYREKTKIFLIITAGLLTANLLFHLHNETNYWKSTKGLAESSIIKHPNSQRALQNYAEYLLHANQPLQSLQILDLIHNKFGPSISNILNQIAIACITDVNASFNNTNISNDLKHLPYDPLVSTSMETLQKLAINNDCNFINDLLIEEYLRILISNPKLGRHHHNLHMLLMQNLWRREQPQSAFNSSLSLASKHKTPQYLLLQIQLAIEISDTSAAKRLLTELETLNDSSHNLFNKDIEMINEYLRKSDEK